MARLKFVVGYALFTAIERWTLEIWREPQRKSGPNQMTNNAC